ncbi:MAG: Uma2 family endonuclease [Thermomicrobiales bacterium]
MAVATKHVTAEDLAAMEPDEERWALIRGELVRMPPAGYRHGRVAARVERPLTDFVEGQDRGVVVREIGFLLARNPDVVLAPDVAFVRGDRLPSGDEEPDGYLALAPDLVVEVVSPSDRTSRTLEKVFAYLEAGVRLVLLVEPRHKSVTVYGQDRQARILTNGDEFDGGDILPGFRLPISAVFR